METGLLLLRFVLGFTLAAHGAQKLFGWFGGHGFEGTSAWLDSIGFKPGRYNAAAVGAAEFGGGLLIVIGLLTPLAAAAIIGVMIAAVATAHWENGFFNGAGGWEFNLLIAATAATLAFAGPGDVSLDNGLGLDLSGNEWGLIAIAIGALAGALVLGRRRTEIETEEMPREDRAAA